MHESNLKIISECCNLLSHASDASKTLQQLCKTLAEAVNARICAICYYDPRELRLVLRASFGLYVEEIQNFQPGTTLTDAAFSRQRRVNASLSNDYSLDGIHAMPSIAKRCSSILIVPLFTNGHAVGALTLCRASQQAFPPWLVETCDVLATPIAAFLQNSDLSRPQNAEDHAEPVGSPNSKAPSELLRTYQGAFLTGKPIVPGVCYGRCLLLASDDALRTVCITKTLDLDAQRKILERAYATVRESLQKVNREIGEILAEADAAIFEMYISLLDDPTLLQRINKNLELGYDVNSALALTFKDFQDDFKNIGDEYLRERVQDVEDVLLRLLNAANNADNPMPANGDRNDDSIVLVARELFPSQLIASPLKQVCGIVCESGGPTSHATILARALRIPMLVGLPNIQHLVHAGDELLVDCRSGLCFTNPCANLLKQYELPLEMNRKMRNLAVNTDVAPDDLPATLDGTRVKLCGNITLFSEMPALHAAGIREIGLYRTEFMFLIRNSMPDEQTQYHVLSRLVADAKGAPVTIRALDIGGDKPLPYIQWGRELNPSLGWRGLRFLLSNPDFTRIHLRAILRVCVNTNVTLMFPMVADKYDLLRAKDAVEDAKHSLAADHVPYGNPKIGMMLELPSAVACLDRLLPEVDFVSIGTDDLVQYLFAVDRGNSRVTQWFRQCHPIVFKLLGDICQTVARHPGKSLELCGELAGNALALPALIGAGLRKLSMNPAAINEVRTYIKRIRLEDCHQLYTAVCACDTPDQVHALLGGFAKLHNS